MARQPTPSTDLERFKRVVHRGRERLGTRWWMAVVVAAGGILQGLAVWSIVDRLGPGVRPPLLDSIIYEYIGWYLSTGARLYVDIWEVKPPLTYEITGLVAAVFGDHMVPYHWTLVAGTLIASVVAALVVGELVFTMTANPTAAAVAGLAPYTYPLYAWRGAVGFKPKYFVILTGLLSVYAALTNRPGSSGALGAASVGFWQLAIGFPAVAAGLVYQQESRAGLRRLVVGAGLTSLVLFAPVILWNAVPQMVVETVLIPLIAGERVPVAERAWLAVRMLGVPTAVGVVGISGIVRAAVDDPDEYWWLAVLVVWLGSQLLFVDLDSAPDLLPLFAVGSIGVGLAVARGSRRARAFLPILVVMLVLSAITILQGGTAIGYSWLPPVDPTPVDTATTPTVPYTDREVRILFWRPLPTETCRPFFGNLQSRYLAKVGATYGSDCGAWEPAWTWIRTRWLG